MRTSTDLDYDAMRHAMVASQLRPNAVNDPRLVPVMARVPREPFFPEDVRELAYVDRVVPIGHGRHMNLPMATGRLLTEAYLTPADRVLLIGAATGYAAAVLSPLVAEVVAVDNEPAFVRRARDLLAPFANVTVVEASLEAGHPEGAPYDALVVDGAVELLPDALLAQLKDGGRLTTGIVENGVTRLASGRRTAGGLGLVYFADSDCARLPGFARPRAFQF